MGSLVGYSILPKKVSFPSSAIPKRNFDGGTVYKALTPDAYASKGSVPLAGSLPISSSQPKSVVTVYPGQQPTSYQPRSASSASGGIQSAFGGVTLDRTGTETGHTRGGSSGAGGGDVFTYAPDIGQNWGYYPQSGDGQGGGGDCPMVNDPVVCPDGNIYGNSCVAAQHSQSGCIPYSQYVGGGGTGGGGWSGWTGAGGGFDMSAPLGEGPGMAGAEPVGYDEFGNAIYGYDENGTPIYGLDADGNVINDPTQAKVAKAMELGLVPVDKRSGKRFFIGILALLAVAYLTFKKK